MTERTSPLERMQERIYNPKDPGSVRVPDYTTQQPAAAYGWEAPPPPPPPKPRMSWAVRFLIGAGIFFVVAGISAAVYLYLGGRSISSDRIAISVDGLPSTIASGDTIPLVVTIKNNNPTQIEETRLLISFPPGTKRGDGSAEPLEQYPEIIGPLAPGAQATRTVVVQLFGAQDQILAMPLRVEYRTQGSNALFVTQDEVTTTVGTSPLSVQLGSMREAAAGQPITITATVRSNATVPLEDIAIMTNFREAGFSVTSSSATPTGGDFYVLGSLSPGETKTFSATGTLTGQAGDTKALRVVAGSTNPDGTSTLGLTYAQAVADIRIARPFIMTLVSFNRSTAEPVVVSAGEAVQALLTWQNSLPVSVRDTQISVELSGNALEPGSVSTGTTVGRTGPIVFNRSTHAGLGDLSAAGSGAASISFRIRSAAALAGINSPTVTARVTTTGTKTENGVSQTISASMTRTIRVATQVGLSSTIAPAAATEGAPTYAITLTATNTIGSVGGVRVVATLPDGLTLGQTDPTVTYDQTARTITWLIGDLTPGAATSISLPVSVLPGGAIGSTSRILGEQTLTGTDRFTGQGVGAQAPALFANEAR